MQKAQQAYLQTQVTTTSQGEMVVMLYDGAIKFLQQAKEKIVERNYAEKGILISKSLDIIAELDASLNVEKGGELSNNLHSLYLYSQGRLLQANLKMDVAIVDEVIKILSSLRGAFAQIINSPEALKAQKQAPEQAPVNVSSFRKQMPFGLDSSAENVNTSQTGPVLANNSVRAKAYQQQFVAGANVQQASLQAQPVQEVKQAEVSASTLATGEVKPNAGVPVDANAFTPAQAAGAAGLTGFGRQMINNSLYKKMAMAPTASPAPTVALVEE